MHLLMKIGSGEWKRLLIDGAAELGAPLDGDHVDAFALHARELLHWNRSISLTTITDPRDVAVKHFLDSLAPAPLLPENAHLLDIGSGGGFPGIPLKVLLPSLTVTLIDASRKKINFLKYVIRSLSLTRTTALHARAESLAHDSSRRNAFDVIICRALASLGEFIPMALPLLKKDGMLISLKGPSFQDELAALAPASPSPGKSPLLENFLARFESTTRQFPLPHLGDPRAIIVFRPKPS